MVNLYSYANGKYSVLYINLGYFEATEKMRTLIDIGYNSSNLVLSDENSMLSKMMDIIEE